MLGVSDEEVHEVLIPIRLTLERFSFAQALEQMTDDDFAELGEGGLDDGRGGADERPAASCVEADIRFHEIVLSRVGPAAHAQIWRTIAPRIRAYFFRYERCRRLRARPSEEHGELLRRSRRATARSLWRSSSATSTCPTPAPAPKVKVKRR